jgi:hypothetical protein
MRKTEMAARQFQQLVSEQRIAVPVAAVTRDQR